MSTSIPSPLSRAARRLALAASLLVGVGGAPAQAATITGQFVNDDEIAVESIHVGGPFHLSVRTQSWATGGFAPVLSLFDLISGVLLKTEVGSSHTCADPGAGIADAMSGFCWDAYFETTLLGGSYALVLSQDGNTPVGDLLAGQSLVDGFSRSGQPDYTGLDYLGLSGHRFINVDTTQRSGDWALDYRTEVLRQIPEPTPWALAVTALLALGLQRRRPAYQPQ